MLSGCEAETPIAIGVGFALMFFLVRYLVGIERRYQAHRQWLLRSGVRVEARLDSLTVGASSPHGQIATSVIDVTVSFEVDGERLTQPHKQSVPTASIAWMRVGGPIAICHDPSKPSDLTIDLSAA